MNASLIRNTCLKWFMLVNSVTTIAFLPLMSYFVATHNAEGVAWVGGGYGAVWFLSGLSCGIADGASSRGLHRELAYASFMFICAFYLLIAGRLFWPEALPLGWLESILAALACAAAVVAIQLYLRRQHEGYTKNELFE
ncbi:MULTISPECIES: hypothetical protein [unclassified Microbacterium]|uniref:hypothetical protein n=1 Tax=unclassified Microbacterium TaxID=2609290 RepID=UPI000C530B5A|nr:MULTISPECIES: hypothetical protein [unclassified Microbacterium]MBU20553.1 hypothetical protein [Microbacterium sp.]HBU42742.1 hypothetical protein [Microbacterium sp.]